MYTRIKMSKKAMGSDGTRPYKKAQLDKLLQLKVKLLSHGQGALQAFIEQAKKDGLPELSSANRKREARGQLLQQCHGGQKRQMAPQCLVTCQLLGQPQQFVPFGRQLHPAHPAETCHQSFKPNFAMTVVIL